jgi:hypothetical protein
MPTFAVNLNEEFSEVYQLYVAEQRDESSEDRY